MAGMSNHLLKPIVPEQMDSSTLFDDAAWAIHGSSKTVLQFSQGGVIFSDVLQVGISSPFEHAVEQAQKMRIRKIFKGLGTSLAKSRAIASWTYASSWGAACAEAIYKYSTGNRPGT
jgi:hypothetical protein